MKLPLELTNKEKSMLALALLVTRDFHLAKMQVEEDDIFDEEAIELTRRDLGGLLNRLKTPGPIMVDGDDCITIVLCTSNLKGGLLPPRAVETLHEKIEVLAEQALLMTSTPRTPAVH
jgi:hypothetical protein